MDIKTRIGIVESLSFERNSRNDYIWIAKLLSYWEE